MTKEKVYNLEVILALGVAIVCLFVLCVFQLVGKGLIKCLSVVVVTRKKKTARTFSR